MGRFSSSDAGRLHILSKLEAEFGFPPLIKVLPCLFANEDVAVNPDDELLERTLEDARSHNKDALVEVDRVPVKVFRVPKGPRRNLFNRRLDPAKLRAIREGQKTRHFFFDRHRTTLVDVEEMKAYALANALTLQSFTDGD
jgi:hypothetical protein